VAGGSQNGSRQALLFWVLLDGDEGKIWRPVRFHNAIMIVPEALLDRIRISSFNCLL